MQQPEENLFDFTKVHYYKDDVIKAAEQDELVLVANSLVDLMHVFNFILSKGIYAVNEATKKHIVYFDKTSDFDYCFVYNNKSWSLMYYDKNLKAKIAYAQNKPIQIYNAGFEKWEDWDNTVSPSFDTALLYRPKENIPAVEKIPVWATHRQISEWLAKGNGEIKRIDSNIVGIDFRYLDKYSDEPVLADYRIRRFGDKVWQLPLYDYVMSGK